MNANYLALYVDNLFVVGKNLDEIRGVKTGLAAEFEMKDLGEAKYLLGIEIRRQKNGDIFITQERYARDVVERFGMTGCKSVSTPLEMGTPLSTTEPATE